MSIWDDNSVVNGKFGSLRKIFAFLISEALAATAKFGIAYSTCIALPQPISPGNHLYLRGPLNHHLMSLERVLSSPWERVKH